MITGGSGAAAETVVVPQRLAEAKERREAGFAGIGTRYDFSEINDRWFGWKNLISSDRRYV